MDTAIGSSNRGFQLLRKMGWKENTSLGKTGSGGIVEPVTLAFRQPAEEAAAG